MSSNTGVNNIINNSKTKLINYANINLDKVEYSIPYKLDTGYYTSQCTYRIANNVVIPLLIETPRLRSANTIIKADGDKLYVDLEIPIDSDFYNFITIFDSNNISNCYDNSKEWFGRCIPLSTIENYYKPSVIIKSGRNYILRANIPVYKGNIACEFFNINRELVSSTYLTPGDDVICIIEISNMKFYNKSFICEWEVKKMKILKNIDNKPTNINSGYIFSDSSNIIHTPTTTPTPTPTPTPTHIPTHIPTPITAIISDKLATPLNNITIQHSNIQTTPNILQQEPKNISTKDNEIINKSIENDISDEKFNINVSGISIKDIIKNNTLNNLILNIPVVSSLKKKNNNDDVKMLGNNSGNINTNTSISSNSAVPEVINLSDNDLEQFVKLMDSESESEDNIYDNNDYNEEAENLEDDAENLEDDAENLEDDVENLEDDAENLEDDDTDKLEDITFDELKINEDDEINEEYEEYDSEYEIEDNDLMELELV